MGKWKHRISYINQENQTAMCAECGPVGVTQRSSGLWVCKTAKREQRGKRSHGLTDIEADEMRADQCCEICGSTERLMVDHDHTTMVVRGVLCGWCNTALGMMKDDPVRLRKAAEYLEK